MTVLQSPEVVLPEGVPETVPPVPVPLVPVLPAVLPLVVPVVVPELVPDVLPVVPPVVPVVPLVVPLIVPVVPLGSHTPSRGSCPGNTVHVAFRPQASKAKGSQSVAQVLDNAAAQFAWTTPPPEISPLIPPSSKNPHNSGPDNAVPHDITIPVAGTGSLPLVQLDGTASTVTVNAGSITLSLTGAPQYVTVSGGK